MLFTFLIYCIYLKVITGDFLVFKTCSESGWGGGPTFPLKSLYQTLTDDTAYVFKYDAVYSIFFLMLSFIFLIRKEYYFFAFAILIILLPLYEGGTISQPRFISVIFPFSLLIGILISKMRVPVLFIFLLFALQLYSYSFWAITDPLSY